MRIHGFYFKWLKSRRLPGVLQRYLPGEVSSLLIDMNGIIHRTSHIVYATDAIEEEEKEKRGKKAERRGPRHFRNSAEDARKKEKMKKRMLKLRKNAARAWIEGATAFDAWLLELENKHFRAITLELINLLRGFQETRGSPIDLLIVSIDGPAPTAKMNQQRSRRFRSGQRQEISTLKNQGGYPWPLFDSNSITPGTDFMFRLDAYLQQWFDEQTLDLPSKVIYYSHMVPGEGEHRIMDDIRNGTVKSADRFEGAHVIYGSDSDLAMLALIAPLNNLYIARDDLTDVININRFREAIFDVMKTKTALNDFVVIFFLVGNDFLPRPPSMDGDMTQSIDSLIQIYHKINGITDISLGNEPVDVIYPLTNQDQHHTINWDSMSVFLKMIGLVENQLLNQLVNRPRQPKFPSAMITKATETVNEAPVYGVRPKVIKSIKPDIFRNLWYSNALLPKTPYEIMSPIDRQLLGPPAVSVREIEQMTLSYLQGIGWINTYYNQGTNRVSLGWFYPWEYSPLFSDIGAMIEGIQTKGRLASAIPPYVSQLVRPTSEVSQSIVTAQHPIGTPQIIPPPPIGPSIYQLLSIFPRASQNLLPIEVR